MLPASVREAALQAALHVASRLKDPGEVEDASALAKTQSLFPRFVHWFPPGIASGNAGIAVLMGELDRLFPNSGWDLVGRTHLEIAVRGAENTPSLGVSLFSGLSGVAFAGLQLSRQGARYRRMLDSLDRAIVPQAISLASRFQNAPGVPVNYFDVISGLSGAGAYLLCRRGQPDIDAALVAVVDALIFLVTQPSDPPAWYTPSEYLVDDKLSYPLGNLNCGLAHGVPGILAFLSLASMAGFGSDRMMGAIAGILNWLQDHRVDDEWGINWPTAVPVEDPTAPVASKSPSRTAWCYGVPGIARALWLAGQAQGLARSSNLAVAAMESVFRRPLTARMIDSPTFCHGVAGLLAVTLRFSQDTGLEIFSRQCELLTQQIIQSFEPETVLGFRNLEFADNYIDQPGLLDGAAGVALVLLNTACGVPSPVDRLFLLA
jgi:lantibiotic biosynthesis protein